MATKKKTTTGSNIAKAQSQVSTLKNTVSTALNKLGGGKPATQSIAPSITHVGGKMINNKGVAVGSSALSSDKMSMPTQGTKQINYGGSSGAFTVAPKPATAPKASSGGNSSFKVTTKDNTMYVNGKAAGSAVTASAVKRPTTSSFRSTTGAPIRTIGVPTTSTPSPVMSYASKDNNNLEAQQARFEEEATQYETPDASQFKRDRMREVRDQINVYERLRAEELARQSEMDTGEQNKLRAILAAAGTTATAYGQGAETRQNQSDIKDAEAINNKYALPITQLQSEAAQKAESDYKNAIVSSAMEQGFTTPTEIARFASSQGIPLSISEIQDYANVFGTKKTGETGLIPALDAAKFGVPYGTTYEQLQGRTINTPASADVTNAQKTKLDNAKAVITSLQSYRDLYNQLVGSTGANVSGTDAATLASAYNAAIFQLAQAVGTGALQAADRAVIEQIIPNPTSFGGAISSAVQGGKTGGLSKIDQAIMSMQNIQNGILQNVQSGYSTNQPQGDYSNIDLNNIDAAIDALL